MKPLIKELVVVNELGLHARAAAKIATAAQRAKSGVWLMRDSEKVDATSVIDILTLDCPKETRVTLIVDDPADIDIFEQISDLLESGFGE